MSQPFSRIPDPEAPRPFKRRLQPGVVQEAMGRAMRTTQRYGKDLWQRGKRHPRTLALVGGTIALTLGGAYALSASGRSLCPAPAGKAPRFILLMDPVPQAAAGSELEIHYDVCGLRSDTPYRGRVRLSQQSTGGKKKAAKPKPMVVTFKDTVDGPATRRSQELKLGTIKPGAYTLELSITDNLGRERKKLQKLVVKAE